MNERIRELFKQTALHRNDHTTEQRLYEVEKFAELIVKECIQVAKQAESEDKVYAWFAIEKHFGIK